MPWTIELDREDDGRWIAEIDEIPGVLVYGSTREEAIGKVRSLALRVLADRNDNGEHLATLDQVFAVRP
jgi:predicted RNase H-like HicB family nuclease